MSLKKANKRKWKQNIFSQSPDLGVPSSKMLTSGIFFHTYIQSLLNLPKILTSAYPLALSSTMTFCCMLKLHLNTCFKQTAWTFHWMSPGFPVRHKEWPFFTLSFTTIIVLDQIPSSFFLSHSSPISPQAKEFQFLQDKDLVTTLGFLRP